MYHWEGNRVVDRFFPAISQGRTPMSPWQSEPADRLARLRLELRDADRFLND